MTQQTTFGRSAICRFLAASTIALAVCSAARLPAFAGELAKEGAFSVTFVNEGRSDAIQLGKDRWGWIFFGRIATTNDSGTGLWHKLSGDCLGMGVGDESSGYCRFADSDGDMIFERWEESVMGKGTSTLLDGTGKFEGIESTVEYDYVVLPSPEGRIHVAGRKRGKYKLH